MYSQHWLTSHQSHELISFCCPTAALTNTPSFSLNFLHVFRAVGNQTQAELTNFTLNDPDPARG